MSKLEKLKLEMANLINKDYYERALNHISSKEKILSDEHLIVTDGVAGYILDDIITLDDIDEMYDIHLRNDFDNYSDDVIDHIVYNGCALSSDGTEKNMFGHTIEEQSINHFFNIRGIDINIETRFKTKTKEVVKSLMFLPTEC